MTIEELKEKIDFIATALIAWDDDAVEFSKYRGGFYEMLQSLKDEISKKGVSATLATTQNS